MSAMALSIIVQVAIIIPGLLLLQPVRLWKLVREERQAVTPRQRFRGMAMAIHRCTWLTFVQLYTLVPTTHPLQPVHAFLPSYLHLRLLLSSLSYALLSSYCCY